MIFKHLFTPKWKHPKTAVRLAAVDKLDTGKDAEVLHTIALQDNSIEIRKKALHKVNDLVLWWQAYKQDQSLKDLAEQQITNAVLNQSNALSDDIRSEYIDKYASNKFLEKLAFAEKEVSQKCKLLKRLANPKLIERAFKEGNESLQTGLLSLIEQYQLDKTVLKSAQGEARSTIENRLEQARLAKVMPEQVEQQTKMVLAKLNVLREKFDYEQVDEQAKRLLNQWQEIELKWLDEESIVAVDKKFQMINDKLATHLEKLKAEFEQEQAIVRAKQEQEAALKTLVVAVDELALQLSSAVSELDATKESQLQDALKSLQAQQSESAFAQSSEFLEQGARLERLATQLTQLPALIDANTKMQQALEALAQVSSTQELEQLDNTLQAQQEAYEVCKATLRQLPDNLQKPASEKLYALSNEFKKAMAPLVDEQQNQLKQARRKGKDVQRLIEQGRFNVAFGVFNGFLEHFEKLTSNNQQSLDKLHTSLSEALREVRDWQKYAATPKRAELLEQLDDKLAETDIDPKKRAAEVKLLRARWNELGRVDTDEERAQAQQFDEKIELLFAPCREYFAEQEQQRAQAKEARSQIIAHMQSLSEQDTQVSGFDWRDFESQFNRLAKQWRSAGNVEGAVYKELNTQYRAAHKSVNDQLKAYHQQNAELKQKLVEQAEQQLAVENLADACEQLKALQKQWQTIGFAGSKHEHTLWQTFRAHNDAVFAKRSEQIEQHKEQQANQEAEQQAQLDALASKLHSSLSLSELEQLADEVKSLELLSGLKKLQKALLNKIESEQAKLQAKKDKQKYNDLIAALEQGDALPANWQLSNCHTGLSAEQLLLRLEILSDIESPAAQKAERMAEQVALLDAKLQGEEVGFEQTLIQYLSVGEGELDASRLLTVLKS